MKILLLNQAFYPDVVSTSQHASDLAARLAERGHEVTAIASSRAYDNPAMSFPRRQEWKGVQIARISSLGFGKTAKWRRALDFGSFFLSCCLRLVSYSRFDVVLALTSPPLIGFLGALFVRLKGGKLVYWVMDLNPDQAIAAGWLRERSLTARLLRRILYYGLRSSQRIVVLDRFAERRMLEKGVQHQKIAVTPPWSHDDVVRYDLEGRRAFRAAHGLSNKFVVMYSGNHSPCHPLDTVLQAAKRLAPRKDISFCFVGGGSEHPKVKEFAAAHSLDNILCLPYQPLSALAASLSSADLHLVVMGDPFVGIVHPCKIYNILALAIPVLYVGPTESHVADLVPADAVGKWFFPARHGDVDQVVRQVEEAARGAAGSEAQQSVAAEFSQDRLLERMVGEIESLASPAVSSWASVA